MLKKVYRVRVSAELIEQVMRDGNVIRSPLLCREGVPTEAKLRAAFYQNGTAHLFFSAEDFLLANVNGHHIEEVCPLYSTENQDTE